MALLDPLFLAAQYSPPDECSPCSAFEDNQNVQLHSGGFRSCSFSFAGRPFSALDENHSVDLLLGHVSGKTEFAILGCNIAGLLRFYEGHRGQICCQLTEVADYGENKLLQHVPQAR